MSQTSALRGSSLKEHTCGFKVRAAKMPESQATVVEERVLTPMPTAEQVSQGFEKGYQEGLAKARAQHEREVSALESLLSSLQQALHTQQQETIDAMMDILMRMIQVLFGLELQKGHAILAQVIEQGLSMMDVQDEPVTLHISDEDWKALTPFHARLKEGCRDLRFTCDSELGPGECFLSTRTRHYELSLERRLHTMVESLKSVHLLQSSADEEHAK